MKLQFFIAILIFICDVNASKYHWRDGMYKGDILSSIVALELRNQTIGTGVFITQGSILTSANILDYMAANGSYYTHILVHHMWGQPWSEHWVWCVRTIHNWNRYRSSTDYWVRQGFDRKHSPVHDLYVLGLLGTWSDSMFLLEPLIANTQGTPLYDDYDYRFANPATHYQLQEFKRQNRPVISVTPDTAISPSEVLDPRYMFYAGFACCNNGTFDEKNNKLLIVTDISLVDCDEWVPREWGYFICMSLDDETRVPSAGTPLFFRNILLGMSSFTMTRNEETIQVFTDIRPYYTHLWVCKPFHMNLVKYKMWRYVTYLTTYIMPIIMKEIAVFSKDVSTGLAKVFAKVVQESVSIAFDTASKTMDYTSQGWANFFG